MNKVFIVANLKSYKNEQEGKAWLEEFTKHKEELDRYGDREVIIAPPFTLLPSFASAFSGTKVMLASQNLSPFDEGAYTGEVNAKQVKDFANYVIIGHSERRNYFKESEEMLYEKTYQAIKYGLTPIFCVQAEQTIVPEGVRIIAYEPTFAIGSGHPDTPESANTVAQSFMEKNKNYCVLYGGSVNETNVRSFLTEGKIKGVLVGSESLNPQQFVQIIQNAL